MNLAPLNFAYLDPGSGSVLLGTILAAFGVFLYSLKSLFYGRGESTVGWRGGAVEDTLVIFSEGKNYWGTFSPIVHELIRREVHFRYFSLDLHDPGLRIDSPYMHSRLFSGKSPASFVKLGKIQAPVMLATTPNVGSENFPLQRSPQVKKMIHVFHAFTGGVHYRKGGLDFYDSVILTGDYQAGEIRKVEDVRKLKAKELPVLGLPYIDDLQDKVSPESHGETEGATVLVGSSWGAKGCLREYGTSFVMKLSRAGFRVVVRPHPHSLVFEPEFIHKCMEETAGDANVSWDLDSLGDRAMSESDILVSDTSSIRFDYAFLLGKPVVTLQIPDEKQEEFESDYFDMLWEEEAALEIGVVVGRSAIDDLGEITARLLSKHSLGRIEEYRDATIKNFGNAAPAIVDYLQREINQQAGESVAKEGR